MRCHGQDLAGSLAFLPPGQPGGAEGSDEVAHPLAAATPEVALAAVRTAIDRAFGAP